MGPGPRDPSISGSLSDYTADPGQLGIASPALSPSPMGHRAPGRERHNCEKHILEFIFKAGRPIPGAG